MKLKIFQKGFNYSQDGPGNRLVYHLQGCNMHCPWCANPEGIAVNGTLMVNPNLLIDSVCPFGAIAARQLDRSRCETCATRECLHQRRNQGIHLSHQEVDIEAAIAEVLQSAPLFYDGGGVTLTGGEPTLQFEALQLLLEQLKTHDIHTAIETNGSHPRLAALFPLVDMLIMDFKHFDQQRSAAVTGLGNSVIKENIARAFSAHPRMLIRIPVIRGFNHSPEDIHRFAAFFKQYNTVNASFEFLAYHEYGKTKWQQCSMPYAVQDGYVGQECLDLFETIFKENQLSVSHT